MNACMESERSEVDEEEEVVFEVVIELIPTSRSRDMSVYWGKVRLALVPEGMVNRDSS